MNIFLLDQDGVCMGVEEYLLRYLQSYGEIINLEKWARIHRLDPGWVREVAHKAEGKGLISLDHPRKKGNPCRVTLGGGEA
jgi:hypothetical protein